MAYNVTLYQYAKKKNSTAQPGVSVTKLVFSCTLMDGSGMLDPTFKFDFAHILNENPVNYNYAYVSEWNRYYFITDWSYNMGLWYCQMTVDPLASWKSTIGGISTYILRSSSNYDRYLSDNFYPAKVGATFATEQNNANPFAVLYSGGYFVTGIINSDSNGYGAVNYYVFTASQFRTFCNYLLSNTGIYNVTDISTELLKCLYNPFQYIVSCTWIPVTPVTGAALTAVPVGWWSIPCTAARLSSTVRVSGTVTCAIPRNPEGATKQFLYAEPYTEYYLDFPPFGSFSISADNLINASLLDMAWDVDCITGMGRLQMGANAAQPFNIVHAQIGVPVQLAQMAPDVFGSMQQALGTTGMKWADSLINTLGNIGNAFIAKMNPMQTTGSTGGFMAGYYPIKLTGIFHGVAQENLSEFGAPLCQTVQIGLLSGFVLCAHGEFDGKATSSEIDMINSYMTQGFYYE